MYQNSQILLEDKIRKMRIKMIESAERNGLNNEITIKQSQDLDQLIYQYQRITYKRPKRQEEMSFLFQQMMLLMPTVLFEV